MSTFHHAARALFKTPAFTLTAIVTLALGIGVNASMFSVLSTLLFHTPPYTEPDTLVRVFRTNPRLQSGPHSPANYLDLAAQTQSFSSVAAASWSNYNLADPGQPAERLLGLDVTGDFFTALGLRPALGRVFGPAEDQPGRNGVVVLSDGFWRRRFAADPGVINRQIRLDGELVTVIGVMPPGFDDRLLWGAVQAWRPMAFTAETRQNRGGNWLAMIARLKPGLTLPAAQSELATISAQLATTYPNTNAQTGIHLVPLARTGEDPTTSRVSWFAMGLAACVLLIACTNLANLQFARNATRARELAIRAALGASRFRLIRQSLTESLLLAFVGGMLGLLVALWCNDALSAHLRIAGEPGFAIPLDLRVIGFTFAATALTGLAFGLLPALLASRTDVNDALKQGTRGSTSGAHHRLRHGLIIAEVALALVLLSGAGFFLRGLERFAQRDHGWRTEGVLTAHLSLSGAKYRDDASTVAFYERLQTRLSALPGIERAAFARSLPFDGFNWGQRFVVEGRPAPLPGAELTRDVNGVSPEYFDALGLPLVAGRAFTAADVTGPARTIINESMARQLWPGESALGKRIAHPVDKEWQEVIGVVRDVSFATRLSPSTQLFQTYRLLAREPSNTLALALRCSVPPETLADAVRRAVAELDPEQPVQDIRPATLVIDRGLANLNVMGWLLFGFALLGLLLAALGIYGVIAGYVAQRTGEIGIRLALGAQLADILRLVLGQGLRLALLGTVVGLAGTFGVARLLAALVPALPGPELLTALGVTLTLLAVALLACWLPARRATRVDPMVALRTE